MHLSNSAIQAKTKAAALTLMLIALWLLMHGYHGLIGDGQLYAFQALARIHPQLATDLYLQNTSQDQFTIFSPLYAWLIGKLGLESAGLFLFVIFTIWLVVAAWILARILAGRDSAWLGAALLLVSAGDYGGSGVFQITEQFMTARLPAEALTVTAIVCHIRGWKLLGFSLALGALLVHPLVALPGLILVICLDFPRRVMLLAAAGGVSAVLAIAAAATCAPPDFHFLTVMNSEWLQVVRERSQFLFLPLWQVRDWDVNAQPFICLAFTATVIPDWRIRKLCLAAALIGASGLAVAFIGSFLGPVAVLIQGQAWRWMWITVFIGVLLLPATVLQVWRDEKCGPLCAILLVSAWTVVPHGGTACASLALMLWALRAHISARASHSLRWLSGALGVAIIVWILTKSWAIFRPLAASTGLVPSNTDQLRDIFRLRAPAALAVVLIWRWIRNTRNPWAASFLCTLLAMLSIFILPTAFKQSRTLASVSEIGGFADWKDAIPPASTVLVTPARDVGGFVWFTLERPNYLAVDQSAGVVFSKITALEVERRSKALLPLMEPNWKILTSQRSSSGNKPAYEARARPLTANILSQICADAVLGFVISSKNVGFSPMRHDGAGAWKNWYLYDCRRVRLGLF